MFWVWPTDNRWGGGPSVRVPSVRGQSGRCTAPMKPIGGIRQRKNSVEKKKEISVKKEKVRWGGRDRIWRNHAEPEVDVTEA